MRPVLFRWRGRAVPSYPAMLYLGLVSGLAVGNVVARALGLPSGRVYLASVVLVVPALIGARLASVVGNWRVYGRTPGRIWLRADGGQAMYGGLVAVPLSIPLLAVLDVPSWRFWDVAMFTMLTGMIFARVGCLLTGCCSGRPTTGRFGMVLPDHRGVFTRRIPTQLLEASFGAALLAGASLVAASDAPPGSVFTGALGAYCLGRLLLQPLRDRQTRVGGLPALRAASAVLLAVSLTSTLARVMYV